MRPQFVIHIREALKLLLESGHARKNMPRALFDLLPLQTNRKRTQAGIKRIGRNRENTLAAAVFVKHSVFRIFSEQKLVVNAFGRDKHQRVIKSVLVRENILLGDAISMLPHGHAEFSPSLV